MSVLRSRIRSQGQVLDHHPYGTGATPMLMPLAVVRYESESDVYYEALQPIITTDGAVIPGKTNGRHAAVIPAGQA
jgi:hypothetical protein